MPNPQTESSDLELERQLLEHMRDLRFPAFEYAIQLLLRRIGYRNVVRVGRTNWRGRSDYGGVDIRAEINVGTGRALALVQVKNGPTRVQRRFVDELRGTMLRYGSSCGLIVTCQEIARQAREIALQYPGRPIQLIDGKYMARLMVKHALGVRIQPIAQDELPKLVVDRLFFDRLDEVAK